MRGTDGTLPVGKFVRSSQISADRKSQSVLHFHQVYFTKYVLTSWLCLPVWLDYPHTRWENVCRSWKRGSWNCLGIFGDCWYLCASRGLQTDSSLWLQGPVNPYTPSFQENHQPRPQNLCEMSQSDIGYTWTLFTPATKAGLTLQNIWTTLRWSAQTSAWWSYLWHQLQSLSSLIQICLCKNGIHWTTRSNSLKGKMYFTNCTFQ